jgi:hypothetical protein
VRTSGGQNCGVKTGHGQAAARKVPSDLRGLSFNSAFWAALQPLGTSDIRHLWRVAFKGQCRTTPLGTTSLAAARARSFSGGSRFGSRSHIYAGQGPHSAAFTRLRSRVVSPRPPRKRSRLDLGFYGCLGHAWVTTTVRSIFVTRRPTFGAIDWLPSGNLRARWRQDGRRVSAPMTFATESDAYSFFTPSRRTSCVGDERRRTPAPSHMNSGWRSG